MVVGVKVAGHVMDGDHPPIQCSYLLFSSFFVGLLCSLDHVQFRSPERVHVGSSRSRGRAVVDEKTEGP